MTKQDLQALTEEIGKKGGLKIGPEAYRQFGDPIYRAQMIGDFLRSWKSRLLVMNVGILAIILLIFFSILALVGF